MACCLRASQPAANSPTVTRPSDGAMYSPLAFATSGVGDPLLHVDPPVEHSLPAGAYQNGVLTVTLPVAARAKPRRIEITPGAREETKLIEPSDSSDQHTTT